MPHEIRTPEDLGACFDVVGRSYEVARLAMDREASAWLDRASDEERRAWSGLPADPEAAETAARVRAAFDTRQAARRRAYVARRVAVPDRAA